MSVALSPISHPPNPHFIVYTDGGARGNPGPAAAAFVVFDAHQQHLYTGGKYLGETTNNVAEYQGVILALQYLTAHYPLSAVHFNLDSKLVCEQLNGHYKIKQPHLKQLAVSVHSLLSATHYNATFSHIPREQNSLADAEVNRILDTQL
jgi:ribonuclease HI